ncbi:MAG: molybdopterin-dependent oxidoreductase [Clostridium sp.]|nr:molybdopterin-dependent oxidoreductase [Clostridium sp.]
MSNRNDSVRYVGQAIPNEDVLGKVTGRTRYCGDQTSGAMLYMKILAGTIAHGLVERVETREAMRVPGVAAIYTCFNTPDRKYDRARVAPYENGGVTNQETLFDRHIRFMGERVAAVVADTEAHAEEACKKIRVFYKELPPVILPEQALLQQETGIHEKDNYYRGDVFRVGDYEAAEGDLVTKSTVHIGRMTHMCLETHTVRAWYEKNTGKLTVWSGCQTTFGIRSTLGDFLDIPYSKIRVIKTTMGGSFGCKQETIIEPLTAYAAKDLGADVMLRYTREEQINNSMMKHSMDFDVESRVRKDGTIEGVQIHTVLDAGAYMTVTPWYVSSVCEKSGKVYRIPNMKVDGEAVCTNTSVNGSFRSWGSSEIALAYETHWDKVAKSLGMDPVEFRLKNVHDAFDRDLIAGADVGDTHFHEILTRGAARFGWEKRRKECAEKNLENGRYRYGVGVGLASHTASHYPGGVDLGSAIVRLNEDGSVIVNVAIHDHGCGTVLAMKKIAADALQIDLERIQLEEADTERCLYDYGCFASRTTYCIGQGVMKACGQLLEKAASAAARMLDKSPCQLVYENGFFRIDAEPDRRVSLAEIYNYALHIMAEDIYAAATATARANPGADCVHFSQVRVDTFTGMTEVEYCLSVHDIGRAINPDLCRAQVGSGVQQGIGIALREEIKIHPETGQTLIDNFKDYEILNAEDMPPFDVLFIEEGDEYGPFGAKSIGEAVLAPVAPAVVNAVNFALGTELTHLPLTPAVILEALSKG